jgi:hypothetical protein
MYVDMGCGMHEWDSPWLKKLVDKPIWETYHWKMMVFCSVFFFLLHSMWEKMFLKVIKMDWVQTCLGLARTHFEFLGFCLTRFLKSIIPLSVSLSLSLSLSFILPKWVEKKCLRIWKTLCRETFEFVTYVIKHPSCNVGY